MASLSNTTFIVGITLAVLVTVLLSAAYLRATTLLQSVASPFESRQSKNDYAAYTLSSTAYGQEKLFKPLDSYVRSSPLPITRGYLEPILPRQGLPRSQIDRTDAYSALSRSIKGFAQCHRGSTYLGRSTFEGLDTSLYSCRRDFGNTRYYGQICHIHPSDGLLHLTLHPEDKRLVLEAGWAASAKRASWWRHCAHNDSITIHAPRNAEELKLVESIVEAAAWWVGGVDSRLAEESLI